MIHIHTSKDLDLSNKDFGQNCFKYPEHKTHWSNHHKVSTEVLTLHESDQDVHVITLSGYVFWSILEAGLSRGTLKREHILIHYHRSTEVENLSKIGPNLEMSAELNSHWDGGGQHIANVRNMLGFYKGDQVNKFTFDDLYKVSL